MVRFVRPAAGSARLLFLGPVFAALIASTVAQAVPVEGLQLDRFGIQEPRQALFDSPFKGADSSQVVPAPSPFDAAEWRASALELVPSVDSELSFYGGLGMRPFEAGIMGHGMIEGIDATWYHGSCSYYCRLWAVPEPGRMELTIAGSTVLGIVLWRRRRSQGKSR